MMELIRYEFDGFCLDPARRMLWKDGEHVPLAAKAFDLLLILIENNGHAIGKEALMRRVWPQTNVVTDNTFSVTLTHARKALGDSAQDRRYIVKTPEGYRFVAAVREVEGTSELVSAEIRRAHSAGKDEDHANASEREIATADPSCMSAKLESFLGGHIGHVIVASVLYSALYGDALLVEVAYQFDRYGLTAILVAFTAACWIFVTSLAGLAVDWKLTLRGSNRGLVASVCIFLTAVAILYAGSCLFLPTEPITQMNVQAYTAQAAYLKTIGYFIFLMFVFLLLPFHFVLVMQRELQVGGYYSTLGLLTGDKMSVPPRRALFLRFWLLVLLFATILIISLFLHHNLMSQLKPAPYMNLFSNLILMRLILYYMLAGECLAWYYRSLNELKRECLMAEGILPGEFGKMRS
jgi:DNA-binding winged helix-turn-helix (wHTH) protein